MVFPIAKFLIGDSCIQFRELAHRLFCKKRSIEAVWALNCWALDPKSSRQAVTAHHHCQMYISQYLVHSTSLISTPQQALCPASPTGGQGWAGSRAGEWGKQRFLALHSSIANMPACHCFSPDEATDFNKVKDPCHRASSSHYQFKEADFALPGKHSSQWIQVSNLGTFWHEIKWPWPLAPLPPTHTSPHAGVLHFSTQTADDETHHTKDPFSVTGISCRCCVDRHQKYNEKCKITIQYCKSESIFFLLICAVSWTLAWKRTQNSCRLHRHPAESNRPPYPSPKKLFYTDHRVYWNTTQSWQAAGEAESICVHHFTGCFKPDCQSLWLYAPLHLLPHGCIIYHPKTGHMESQCCSKSSRLRENNAILNLYLNPHYSPAGILLIKILTMKVIFKAVLFVF